MAARRPALLPSKGSAPKIRARIRGHKSKTTQATTGEVLERIALACELLSSAAAVAQELLAAHAPTP